jgi:DNA-binding response OmpR family regulator
MNTVVLAAEDEESDALILRMAFQRARLPSRLVVVPDGEDVIEYLAGTGRYADRSANPAPGLLLLDLKMPRMNGIDVLQWMASRNEFQALPTVVLSSSPDETDIRRAREAGARDYFIKPHSLTEFVALLQALTTRWLRPDGPDGSPTANDSS